MEKKSLGFLLKKHKVICRLVVHKITPNLSIGNAPPVNKFIGRGTLSRNHNNGFKNSLQKLAEILKVPKNALKKKIRRNARRRRRKSK